MKESKSNTEQKDTYTMSEIRSVLLNFFSENEQLNLSDLEKLVSQSKAVVNKSVLKAAFEKALSKLESEELISNVSKNNWIIQKRFYELSSTVALSYDSILKIDEISKFFSMGIEVDPKTLSSESTNKFIKNLYITLKELNEKANK